eukprot:6057546-Prymnesium_polylepis.1
MATQKAREASARPCGPLPLRRRHRVAWRPGQRGADTSRHRAQTGSSRVLQGHTPDGTSSLPNISVSITS